MVNYRLRYVVVNIMFYQYGKGMGLIFSIENKQNFYVIQKVYFKDSI